MGAYYDQGRYWCRITDQALSESKEKKTPCLALTFQVLGRVNEADPDGELERCLNYERTCYIYLTEKTMEFAVETLKVLGFDKPSLKYLDLSVTGACDLRNSEVVMKCGIEDYQGKSMERWSVYRERGAMEHAPLEKTKLRQLDALFGKSLKAAAASSSKPVEQPEPVSMTVNPNHSITAPETDDVPF